MAALFSCIHGFDISIYLMASFQNQKSCISNFREVNRNGALNEEQLDNISFQVHLLKSYLQVGNGVGLGDFTLERNWNVVFILLFLWDRKRFLDQEKKNLLF